MPPTRLALILASVVIAVAVTVWLLGRGTPGLLVAALPAFLIFVIAIKVLRR